MCNNHIITRNTTGSVHRLVGPKPQPHHGPHDWGPPIAGGRGARPPRSGAPSRHHATPPCGWRTTIARTRGTRPPLSGAPSRSHATPRPAAAGGPPSTGGGPAPPRSPAPSRRHATPLPRHVYIGNHIAIFLLKINYIIPGVCLLPAILPVYVPFLDENLKQYHWVR